MTGSVKIASRVNAVVASEVQRAEDWALITGVLVAIRRGLGIPEPSVENIARRRWRGST
jgi:hypothetical protein